MNIECFGAETFVGMAALLSIHIAGRLRVMIGLEIARSRNASKALQIATFRNLPLAFKCPKCHLPVKNLWPSPILWLSMSTKKSCFAPLLLQCRSVNSADAGQGAEFSGPAND
jgi:hypothetical protein